MKGALSTPLELMAAGDRNDVEGAGKHPAKNSNKPVNLLVKLASQQICPGNR